MASISKRASSGHSFFGLRTQVTNWAALQELGRRLRHGKIDMHNRRENDWRGCRLQHPARLGEKMKIVVGLATGLVALLTACTPAAVIPSSPTPTTPALATPTSASGTPTRPAATSTPVPAAPTVAPATPTSASATPTLALATPTRPAATSTPAAAPATPTPAAPPTAGDATAGKALFAAKGCAACHGAEAQGGLGPNLKTPKREANLVTTTMRSGRGLMPAFTQAQVSDAELQNITAFLQAP
ncbi:MAG: c-type cytochrome [Chloroflexi bacterium]|nr:c-type cytochrome [Chloroflexota bacterium]